MPEDGRLQVVFVEHTGQPGGGQLGIERYFGAKSRHERRIVFLESGPVSQRLSEVAARVETLGSPTGKWLGLLRTPKLFVHLRRAEGDVIVANSMKAATALAFSPRGGGVRVLYLRDDLNRERLSKFRWWFLVRVVASRFDAYMTNSAWTASTLPDELRSRPVRVAYPVSGTTSVGATQDSKMLDLRILSLSRIAEWKGTHVLVEALRILDERGVVFTATIAGTPLFESKRFHRDVQRAASTIRSDVQFVGHVDNVQELLHTHNVLVSCTITPEPFGQVIVQGMSSGLAVVATKIGGPIEITEGGLSGMLVEPNNPRELADALELLGTVVPLRERLVDAGLRRAAEFSDERTVAGLDDAISEIYAAVMRVRR